MTNSVEYPKPIPNKQHDKVFFFEGNSVGYFEELEMPSTPGVYRYMPYRGPGHYRLNQALTSSGPQHCHYLIGSQPRYFMKSRPSYAFLNWLGFDDPL